MNEVLLIAGMALVTFAVRYPVMAFVGRIPLPEGVIRALRYVPVAVLTAIIVPAAVMPAGTADFRLSNAYLFGSIAALLIAWRTKNLLLTIALGMAFFFAWRALIPG